MAMVAKLVVSALNTHGISSLLGRLFWGASQGCWLSSYHPLAARCLKYTRAGWSRQMIFGDMNLMPDQLFPHALSNRIAAIFLVLSGPTILIIVLAIFSLDISGRIVAFSEGPSGDS